MNATQYIHARRGNDGRYRLYYRGTRNEAAAGHSFATAAEARRYFTVRAAVIDGHRQIGSDAALEIDGFDSMNADQLSDELAYLADFQG